MNNSILITVILPTYNCEKYVKDAVNSILNQTYSNLEVIIIDDCSTDSTLQIIKSYQDSRIQLIEKEKNTGYTDSLNYGISIAKGKYIARMDGDDISLPRRFQKQIDFLESNPEVVICGTAIKIIGKDTIERHPSNHEDLQIKLCFSSIFHHPTVMMRAAVLKQNHYDKDFEPAEDYELWTRLAFVGKTANLEDVLLHYRIHSSQTSSVRKTLQDQNIFRCQMIMFNKFFIEQNFTINQIKTTLATNCVKSKEAILTSLKLYNYVIELNSKINVFNQKALEQVFYNKKLFMFRAFLKNNSYTITALFFVMKTQGFKGFLKTIQPFKVLKRQVKQLLNFTN